MKIKGKRIIVTGGANGIGKELVLQLLEKGAYVTAVDINEEKLKKLKEEVNTDYLDTYTLDILNYDAIDKFKEEYLKSNNLDILINNAGIIQPFVNIKNIDDNIINKVMGINF
ncbi:MAG TPA: SDR family NAD(P)-dependent oxidoreductase, partial [Bacilli bacterium]|nr:SDR family NAD(P)-dependent oxidoreductase [Bacilli bacterium]